MAGESIKFDASLNTVGFSSGAKAMQDIASKASASVANHFAKMAGSVLAIATAFVGVRAAAQSFSAAITLGGQLNDLSARTGESAGNLLILRRAFDNAGAGADSVGPTINRLQRAIVEAGQGSKEQAEAFARLGLNIEDLKNRTPTEQLQSVAQALSRVSTDSDRTALAMQLLGRSGGELIPLLRAMGVELDVAKAQLGSTPDVMNKVSQAFDTIGDNFGAIGEKSTEFAAGLLEKLAPALAEITTKLATIDAAGFGQAVSGYIEQTLKWINTSLGLSSALDNIRTAIAGIGSGNFGDGLSLMFMTARDTAFNAINEIVAAASAAISSVSGAVGQMFDPNGAVVLLMKSTFSIAANYFKEALYGALADFMDAIGRSGMADTFRYQAETAARSIEMLSGSIGAQFEEVGEQAKTIFSGIPASFRTAYEANVKNPLLDMKDRTLETAAAAEKLAAAVRAAGFDAKTFGDNMASAREEMLAGAGFNPFGGPPETGEMGINPDGRRFSFQGAGPSGAPIVVPPGGPTSSATGGGSVQAPKTPIQRLEIISSGGNVAARAALMRAEAEQARNLANTATLAERGLFSSAARQEIRSEERMQDRAMRELTKQTRDQFFGARNAGDAARNFERDAFKSGMTSKEAMDKMGIDRKLGESTRDALDRFAKEQAKTERERVKEAADKAGEGGGGGGRAASLEPATEATLKQIFEKIQERPILVA